MTPLLWVVIGVLLVIGLIAVVLVTSGMNDAGPQ